jgi:prepilin-type N-terminal cleavage/methylation domain-containing protein/prepilin-type processing-associated H-X9-DG protein
VQQTNCLRNGFTLVELLVVVAVLGVLIGLILPAVQVARESARRVDCANKVKQVSLGLHNHESTFRTLPTTLSSESRQSGLRMLYWQAQVLSFLEQEQLFALVRSEVSQGVHIYGNTQRTAHIPIYQCPSNPDAGKLVTSDYRVPFAFTDYCGVAGATDDDGVFPLSVTLRTGVKFRDVTGGLSNTLLLGERPPTEYQEGTGAWIGGQYTFGSSTYLLPQITSFGSELTLDCARAKPFRFGMGVRGDPCDFTHHWSFHSGGVNFSRVDGSVSFLSYHIDEKTLQELASRDF